MVGSAGSGSLATSFADGARAEGHVADVHDFPELMAGSRSLFLSRRLGLDQLTARALLHRLRLQLEASSPDLVLVVKGRFLGAAFVRGLRRALNVPVLNYYPDHPLWPGHDDPEILAALLEYDEVLVWGSDLQTALEQRGVVRSRLVQFGYDPAVYRRRPATAAYRWDVAVVGQCYEQRLRFAEALVEFDVLVSGLGWSRAAAGGPLAGRTSDRSYPGADTCELYWGSRVAVNILADWNVPAHNMRTFEIPASETAMVATRTPDHETLFGEEGAVLVSSPEEARSAIGRLLADPERLKSVARIGRERIERHTYSRRMRDILAPWQRAS